jgi:murein DD-endopeptidase MepM/ murein hydrolase activator NlpD
MRDSSRALGYAPSIQSPSDQADHAFSAVTFALRTIEREQLSRIETLTGNALSNAESIEDALASVGMRVAAGSETHAGGPYLPALTGGEAAAPSGRFETSLDALDQALLRLETVRDHALVAPLGHPVPGHGMTSRFGNRTDPFLRRPAFHAGLDFRSPTGTAVQAAGNGTVSFAGRSGGYGNMVEIRHGDGLTTRYAHLSRIFVSSGDAIVAGQRIGAAGSTGRSTGPHLHYEVRRDGKPIDPIRFLRAGEQVAPLLVSR